MSEMEWAKPSSGSGFENGHNETLQISSSWETIGGPEVHPFFGVGILGDVLSVELKCWSMVDYEAEVFEWGELFGGLIVDCEWGVQRSDCGESEWSFLWTCSSRQYLLHRRASRTVDLSLAVVYYNDIKKWTSSQPLCFYLGGGVRIQMCFIYVDFMRIHNGWYLNVKIMCVARDWGPLAITVAPFRMFQEAPRVKHNRCSIMEIKWQHETFPNLRRLSGVNNCPSTAPRWKLMSSWDQRDVTLMVKKITRII